MTLVRRPFLLETGEQLLLSPNVLDSAARFVQFVEQSGLDAGDVVSDPIVAVPLPVYYQGGRFSGVTPDLMWLPLFWLPESIGLRFQVIEDEGQEPRAETDVEWAVRVALELQAANLYSAENGWVDVLALFGLDIENPVDIARIEAWQRGSADQTLDAIDITAMFAGEQEWAFREAADLLPIAQPAQFALTAASLLNALEEHPDSLGDIAAIGAEMLFDEPSDAADTLNEASEALGAGAATADWEKPVRGALESVIDEYADALATIATS